MKFSIGGKEIGDGAPVYVIAEIGVNHGGDTGVAKSLILAAKSSGADAAKFQAFRAKDLVGEDSPQFDILSRLELSAENLREMKTFCDSIGIHFLASAFDIESLRTVLSLGAPAVKIPSGEIVNEPLLCAAAASELPLLVSTGMSEMNEIESAVSILTRCGALERTVFLHCVSAYPAPVSQLNLRAIAEMRRICTVPVGFSDHTTSTAAPVAAVSLGACVIEKHLTFSRNAQGPDHHASLTSAEFSQMVRRIREIESALGDGRKRVMDCERVLRGPARRGIYAARDIHIGEVIIQNGVWLRRPDVCGIRMREVIGKRASCEIPRGEPITFLCLASPWLTPCAV